VLRNHKGCLFILLMALGLLGWVSGPAAAAIRIITHLCGVRTETCPPGMKTGDPISPPGGYVGGDMQMLTDIAIDPAGNVWVGKQLAGRRQVLRQTAGSQINPLRRQRITRSAGRRRQLTHVLKELGT
jgi:hypothetical protein